MVEAGPDERNRAATDRLRALAQRLSDDDLRRLIDPPWTASALFAHIAFWDRFVRVRWERVIEQGGRIPAAVDDALSLKDEINDASMSSWLAVPARIAAEECVGSAEAIDELLSQVDPNVVAELITASQPRLVDRSLHRNDHLRTLESAFPRADSARLPRPQSRSTSRWLTETRCPCSRNQSARSSATTTDRCRPPVHPIATVR
jgi:DinB superfamily